MRVDLIWLGDGSSAPAQWSLGKTATLPDTPCTLAPALDAWVATTDAEFCLFWHSDLGAPDAAVVESTLNLPGDVWHAGLRLGMAGLPTLMDCVNPIWMLNRDADPQIVASSWRLSLDACLVRVEVLRQLGGIDPAFDTRGGASLDLGLRWLRRGAIVRHVPALAAADTRPIASVTLPLHDELRLVRQHHGAKWMAWCQYRGLWLGHSPAALARAGNRIRREGIRSIPAAYRRPSLGDTTFDADAWHGRVSVIIPTLDRYSYLRSALTQLRDQSVRPKEIFVVDQTPAPIRDTSIAAEFSDLPLTVVHQDQLGQCTARNHGISTSTGDFLLFMDDDTDEIPQDFIEALLRTCVGLRADLVASAVEEAGAGPIPEDYLLMRIVDIFPVGTLTRRTFFDRAGLFDTAFDRGARADADVAMRGYLSGALMILNPAIRVAHWRASRGGLRVHGARVVTRASSRAMLTHRHVPSHTELFLVMRYFTPRQLREMLWQRVIGTFVARGSAGLRVVKALVSALYLPGTLLQIRRNMRRARIMIGEAS